MAVTAAVRSVVLEPMTPEIADGLPDVDPENPKSITPRHLQAYHTGLLHGQRHQLVEQALTHDRHGMTVFRQLKKVREALGVTTSDSPSRTTSGKAGRYERFTTARLMDLANQKLSAAKEIIERYRDEFNYNGNPDTWTAEARRGLRAEDKALATVLEARGEKDLASGLSFSLGLANYMSTNINRTEIYETAKE